MRLFLNAGFGEPLGQELEWIKELGFHGVRQDIPDAESTEPLCDDLAGSPLTPILLVAGGKMGIRQPGMSPEQIADLAHHVAVHADRRGLFDREFPAALEIGNEPDIEARYRDRPALFARVVREGARRIREVSSRAVIISGGIANTDDRGLSYLDRAMRAGFPNDCAIGYHAYRTTTTPEAPMKGFATRDAEFARLKELAQHRPIYCTETGWHTAPSTVRTGWFGLVRRKVRFTDEQVADFFDREVTIHERNGTEVFAWFQLNDGANPDAYEQAFGIRRLNRELKPVGVRVSASAARLAGQPASV